MEEVKTDTIIQPQNCGFATWSMGLGITGLVLCIVGFIPALLAIIFGIVGLVKISKSKGMLLGKGRSLAGIIMGGAWIVMIPFIIIAAIAIPNLLSSRMSAGESSTSATLKLMVSAEATWFQQDPDGNGIKDYWTYDVSCFYRALRADNETKIDFIPISLARADGKPARLGVFGKGHFQIADLPESTLLPRGGYYFQMMELDENGQPYNQEMVNGVPATNKTKFAIVAYPDVYGTSGVNTFIVNQEGIIYANDCGSDAQKIVLQWPGINPSEVTGPGGRQWRCTD